MSEPSRILCSADQFEMVHRAHPAVPVGVVQVEKKSPQPASMSAADDKAGQQTLNRTAASVKAAAAKPDASKAHLTDAQKAFAQEFALPGDQPATKPKSPATAMSAPAGQPKPEIKPETQTRGSKVLTAAQRAWAAEFKLPETMRKD